MGRTSKISTITIAKLKLLFDKSTYRNPVVVEFITVCSSSIPPISNIAKIFLT
jgi:hypothetical protein